MNRPLSLPPLTIETPVVDLDDVAIRTSPRTQCGTRWRGRYANHLSGFGMHLSVSVGTPTRDIDAEQVRQVYPDLPRESDDERGECRRVEYALARLSHIRLMDAAAYVQAKLCGERVPLPPRLKA